MFGARLFICHSHDFVAEAQVIASRLGGFAARVFIDRHGVIVGDDVSSRIKWQVRMCDAAVVVVDPRFRNAGYRQWEFRALWRRFGDAPSGRMLPVLVAGASASDVPPELAGLRPLAWGQGGELELSEAIERLTLRRRRRLLTVLTFVGGTMAAALVRGGVVDVGGKSDTFVDEPRQDPGDDELERGMQSSTGATVSTAGSDSELYVPPSSQAACARDSDCAEGQRCHRRSTTTKVQLSPSVVKAVDRRTHSKLVGQRCPSGGVRVGDPLFEVTPGGRCEVEWRAPVDESSCEVDAVADGPSHQEIRCKVFVKVRRRGQGKCVE